MIEFFKNLFGKKKKDYDDGYYSTPPTNEKHYVYDDDIDVFINEEDGVIRVEAPADKPLTHEQIIDICKKYTRDQ